VRIIKKYLFARAIRIKSIAHHSGHVVHQQLVAVEGFTKDHAIRRLIEKWPDSKSQNWDFLDELDPEHFVGVLGTDMPLFPHLRGKS
jgi:hypothetical protein